MVSLQVVQPQLDELSITEAPYAVTLFCRAAASSVLGVGLQGLRPVWHRKRSPAVAVAPAEGGAGGPGLEAQLSQPAQPRG